MSDKIFTINVFEEAKDGSVEGFGYCDGEKEYALVKTKRITPEELEAFKLFKKHYDNLKSHGFSDRNIAASIMGYQMGEKAKQDEFNKVNPLTLSLEELSRLEKLVKTDIEIIEQDMDRSKLSKEQNEILDSYHRIDQALLKKLEELKC